jgi:hypothetical protein
VIQEGIATAIAASLRVPLGLKPGETLITSRLADPEIYDQFLQLRSRTFPAPLDAKEAFVARAPDFAPGWAMLAGAYRTAAAAAQRNGDLATGLFLTDKDEAAARKAIQLDPSYAGGPAPPRLRVVLQHHDLPLLRSLHLREVGALRRCGAIGAGRMIALDVRTRFRRSECG